MLRNYSQTAASSDRGICFVWPACRVPVGMGQPPALKASFSPKGYSRALSTTFQSDTPGSSHQLLPFTRLPKARRVPWPARKTCLLVAVILPKCSLRLAYYCQSTTTTGAEADSLPLLVVAGVAQSLIQRSRCLRSEPDEQSAQPMILYPASVETALCQYNNCGELSPRARSPQQLWHRVCNLAPRWLSRNDAHQDVAAPFPPRRRSSNDLRVSNSWGADEQQRRAR